MARYNEPSFQDRVATAANAREQALARLKAKPALDTATLAERAAKARAREAAKAARDAEKAAAREAAGRLAEEHRAAAIATLPTEADRKAARDARYAERKNR